MEILAWTVIVLMAVKTAGEARENKRCAGSEIFEVYSWKNERRTRHRKQSES
jgi:hypothetical protein